MADNPMHKAHAAPRCRAHSKRTGMPCRNPAVRGWNVCRMHGARGGHKAGSRHPKFKHGAYSLETQLFKATIRELIHESRETLQDVGQRWNAVVAAEPKAE